MAALLLAGVLAVGTSAAAEEAFPGRNGLIVYAAGGIYTVREDGTGRKKLTRSGAVPKWSPDGRQIAYCASRTGGNDQDVYVMRADGGEKRRLTRDGGTCYPNWSYDASRLIVVFTGQDGRPRTDVINADGSGRRTIFAAVDENETDPSVGGRWSPDGRFILYTHAHSEVWLLDPRGAPRLRVGEGELADWFPDATSLALLQGTEVREVRLDGSSEEVLLFGRGQAGDLLAFALSPDARRVVFSHSLPIGGERESRLFVSDLGAERWHPLTPQYAVSPDWQPVCTLYGTERRDVLIGTSERDVICGLGGDDTIHAGGGDDIIQGGDGNDCLRGGVGRDWLFGGPGHDTLLARDGTRDIAGGGPGRDRISADSGSTDIQRELEGRTLNSRCLD